MKYRSKGTENRNVKRPAPTASKPLTRQRLQDAICSICLEYLTDPVRIDYGHNFCRACILQYCEKGGPELNTMFPCLQCWALSQKSNLRPNTQLANILEQIKQLGLEPSKQQEDLCEKHEEKFKLFCEKDETPLCVVCRQSQAHGGHIVVPIEEVAQKYKVGDAICLS